MGKKLKKLRRANYDYCNMVGPSNPASNNYAIDNHYSYIGTGYPIYE